MSDMSVLAGSPAHRLVSVLVRAAQRLTRRLQVQAELGTMDDRTLADLGLTRHDVARVARAHAALI